MIGLRYRTINGGSGSDDDNIHGFVKWRRGRTRWGASKGRAAALSKRLGSGVSEPPDFNRDDTMVCTTRSGKSRGAEWVQNQCRRVLKTTVVGTFSRFLAPTSLSSQLPRELTPHVTEFSPRRYQNRPKLFRFNIARPRNHHV
jgi:hypothetical protein